MVRLVLEPRVRDRSARELLALRVCDPAIGPGAFLVEVVTVLAEHLQRAWAAGRIAPAADAAGTGEREAELAIPPADRSTWGREARRRIAGTCVAGVDVDPTAVRLARAALGLDGAAALTRGALRAGDALELDWRAAYPEVFARGGFDVVVGNPPYIRQEQLAGPAGKARLARFASFDGTADLYVYFLELGHHVLRAGGAYCWIVPTKWMTVAYGRRLRGYLAAQGSIDGIVDLARAPVFADAEAFPCIVWGTAGRQGAAPVRGLRPEGLSVARALQVAVDAPPDHARERWGAGPWHIDTAPERALLERLEQAWPPLSEVVRERPARGVVTGLNRAFVIDRATRDRIVGEDPEAASLVRPFVKGRDVKPWLAPATERWILLVDRGTSLEQRPSIRAHLEAFRSALEPRPPGVTGTWRGRKPGAYAWYELQDPVGPLVKARAPRLLYQDIQSGPACSLDRDGELVPDTTVWMLPTADRFLLAVLNSPVYAWYARRRFPPALNGAVRPKLAYVRTLPIARPAPALRVDIERLVDDRLALAARQDAGRAAAGIRQLDVELARAIALAYDLSAAERRLVGVG